MALVRETRRESLKKRVLEYFHLSIRTRKPLKIKERDTFSIIL